MTNSLIHVINCELIINNKSLIKGQMIRCLCDLLILTDRWSAGVLSMVSIFCMLVGPQDFHLTHKCNLNIDNSEAVL